MSDETVQIIRGAPTDVVRYVTPGPKGDPGVFGTILDRSGAALAQRGTIQGLGLLIEDDAVNGRTRLNVLGVDVREFFPFGFNYASGDATAYVQAAIDGAIDGGLCILKFPPFALRISQMLAVHYAVGLHLIGAGRGIVSSPGSQLIWICETDDQRAMIDMLNCRQCDMDRMLIVANNEHPPTDATLLLRRLDGDHPPSTSSACVFRGVTLVASGGDGAAAAIPLWIRHEAGSFNDGAFHEFYGCEFDLGCAAATCAVRIGADDAPANNSKNLLFMNCVANVQAAAAPHIVENYHGSYEWVRGYCVGCTDGAFHQAQPSDPIEIRGTHFEICSRAFSSVEMNVESDVTLRGLNFDTSTIHADGNAIVYPGIGPLNIENCTFGTLGEPIAYISFGTSLIPARVNTLNVTGCKWSSFGSGEPDAALFRVTGDTRINATGNAGRRSYPAHDGSVVPLPEYRGLPGSADLATVRATAQSILLAGDRMAGFAWQADVGTNVIDDGATAVRPSSGIYSAAGIWLLDTPQPDVATLIDLRRVNSAGFAVATVNSDIVAGDGGGGTYTYDADSTATDDGINVLAPSTYVQVTGENDLTATGWVHANVTTPAADTVRDSTDAEPLAHALQQIVPGFDITQPSVWSVDVQAVGGSSVTQLAISVGPSAAYLIVDVSNGSLLAHVGSAQKGISVTATPDGSYRVQFRVGAVASNLLQLELTKALSGTYQGDGTGYVKIRRVLVAQPQAVAGRWLRVGQAFSEHSLSSAEQILDGDDGLSGSGASLVWNDQSGERNDASAGAGATGLVVTASDSDFGGHGSVTFNGTDDWLAANGIGALASGTGRQFYVCEVVKYIHQAGPRALWSWSNSATSAEHVLRIEGNVGDEFNSLRLGNSGGLLQVTGGSLDTTAHIVETLYDGTSITVCVDGATAIATTAESTVAMTVNEHSIGVARNGGANSSFGNYKLGARVVAGLLPSATERARLRSLYAARFGL